MSESAAIEPALTLEQWAKVRKNRLHVESVVPILTVPADMPRIIAVANAGLLDGDPRKITRAMIQDIREVAHLARDVVTQEYGIDGARWGNVPRTLAARIDRTLRHADVLESYLPPAAPG